MKGRFVGVLIGIFGAGMFFSVFPASAEERAAPPDLAAPSGGDSALSRPAPSGEGENDKGGGRLDNVLRFEGGRPKTAPPERESEALRLHETTVLDRFEGADNHGQLSLSFSENRVDLNLRSITGAEAPVAGTPLRQK